MSFFRWEGERVSGRSPESSPSTNHWFQNLSAEEILGRPRPRLHDLRRVQRHRGSTSCMPGRTTLLTILKSNLSTRLNSHLIFQHLSPSSFLRVTLAVLCCASWTGTAGRCTAWWVSAPSVALWRTNPASSPAPSPTSPGSRQRASGTSSCTERSQQA